MRSLRKYLSKQPFCIVYVSFAVLFVMAGVVLADEDKYLTRDIGQMILVGFRGTEAPQDCAIRRAIREVKIGGVILFDIDVPSGRTFPRNIVDPAQTKKLIADLQKDSQIPLFIAVDAEGGKVNRLKSKYGFAEIPGAQEVGRKNDVAYTRQVADTLAGELTELGFNMDFAPDVDVNINPDNPVIGSLGRSFSKDPAIVAKHACVYIESFRKKNIIGALKHFPGHGSSMKDSHLGLVDVTDTYRDEELVPYELLIRENKIDCIMTAHIMNRRIDKDRPATLSSDFLNDILRKKLQYKGMVISDDLNMQAIASRYTLAESVVLAINAGCDIVLASNNAGAPRAELPRGNDHGIVEEGGKEYDEQLAYKIRDAILQAVKDGRISKERIREAAGRISAVKGKYLKKEAAAVLKVETR